MGGHPSWRGTGRGTSRLAISGLVLLVGACAVGPDYRRPPAPIPVAYKEAAAKDGWLVARPADAFDRGAWWAVYDDPVLDSLERQVDISNQNLKAAQANFRQAEAIVAQARAGFFPTATVNAQAQRSRGSGTLGRGPSGPGSIANLFSISGAASWIPDLWGKVERTVESDVANAQANAADVASARLAVQGQLAVDYLQLRIADELKRLLDAAATAYAESLRITQNQYNAGIVAASDVAQARTQLESTRAQAIATGVLRSQVEHAIAVLIGKPPADLTIAAVATVPPIPIIPPGLPSELLERRPDIAGAERRMAAANAQIGVAEAAFFPTITLSASTDSESEKIGKLLSKASRTWAFGSTLAETIFDAGARHAVVEQNRALLEAAIADYRQTVLTGFQQIEDELAALRILANQAAAEDLAVASSRQAEQIIFNQYKAGTVAYTNVVVAQTAALANAETALNIRQSRLLASAALIQALGGGWDASQLPSRDIIEADVPLNFSPLPPSDALSSFWDSLPKLW
ncbi:MAG: efflux transporter outer membrane subunit [Alphaproteobacteria bacterium]|nr:efflux transporter outer membrane subunit [Alphaproteobacteria bacterium]